MTLRAGSSLGPALELGTHEEQQSRALSWTCPQAGLSIGQKFSVPIHVLSSLVLPGLQTVPAITVAARPWVPYLSARPSAAPHSMKLSVPRLVSSPSRQGTMFYWGLEPGSESYVLEPVSVLYAKPTSLHVHLFQSYPLSTNIM